MKNTNKHLLLIILLALFIPQVVFAAWWNPLSWFDNWTFPTESIKDTKVVEVIENKEDDSTKKVNPSINYVRDTGRSNNESVTETPTISTPTPIIIDTPITPPTTEEESAISVNLQICGEEGKCSRGPLELERGYKTFKWSTEGVTSCTASGSTLWTGEKDTSGEEEVFAGNIKTGENTYVLTCNVSEGGTLNDSVYVNFVEPPKAPTSVNLQVCGSEGKCSGGPIPAEPIGYRTFKWTTEGAVSCEASGDTLWIGEKDTSGEEEVFAGNIKTGENTYTLTCRSDEGGELSDSVDMKFSY